MDRLNNYNEDVTLEILNKLNENRVKNIMTIDPIERKAGKVLLYTKNSLVVKTSESFLIHSNDERDTNKIIKCLEEEINDKEFYFFLVHDEFLCGNLAKHFGFNEVEPYLNSVVPDDCELEEVKIKNLEFKKLTMDHFNFVRSNYKLVDSDDYIKERIEYGMIGAFLNGELVGFVGEHNENTMGMLEVKNEYRRLGIGKALSYEIIKKVRSENKIPHCNTSVNNKASLELQKKCGFEICYDPVYWMFK